MVEFIDFYSATIAALKQYRDMEFLYYRALEKLSIGIKATDYSKDKVQSSSGRSLEDEALRIAAANTDYKRAVEYMQSIAPAIARLEEEEKDIIRILYIDREGAKKIMDKYHIEERTVYHRARKAIDRLSKMIVWY